MGTFTVQNENQKELDEYIMKKWDEGLRKFQESQIPKTAQEVKAMVVEHNETAKAIQEAAPEGTDKTQRDSYKEGGN